MFEKYLTILNDHNGNMSLEYFQYISNTDDQTDTYIRNKMEKAGLVEHRYGQLILTEAGKQQLREPNLKNK